MSSARTRLILYALLSAVEKDLRTAITDFVLPYVELREAFGEDVVATLIDRCRRDGGDVEELQSLVEYSNLSDALHVLSRNSTFLGEKGKRHYKTVSQRLNALVPTRNRVMHTRPLQFDDHALTFETCRLAVKSHPVLWRELSETMHKIEDDPAFLLNLSITAPDIDSDSVLHNLPTPDFDDTGFIGREDELNTISSAIKGPYPVITLTGEGGLGKTALALKACYDLIDSDKCDFDAVIWTSAKTTRLTPSEIHEISSAVSSSIGIFDAATEALGLDQSGEPISRLLDQLRDFRVLLVIDNLETVLDDNVRRVVREVPAGSKILFTSRVSIGAFDFPIPLAPLGDAEALTYFRACARYWGLGDLVKLSNDEIKKYLSKLYNNPLFIKWFLQSVAQGQSPNRILANPKIILEFCLSNVIENLSHEAIIVLETLVFLGDARPISILCLMTELQPMVAERAVNELAASNLVDIVDYANSDVDQKFQATSLAKFYVRNYVDPTVNQSEIVRRKKDLAITREQLLRVNNQNEFDMDQIMVRGEEDIPPAKVLKEAISLIKRKEFSEARRVAESAIEISPNYFECHRVLASVCALSGSFMKAQDAYEAAISLFSDYAPLRLWYGDFLLRYMDDLNGAEEQYNNAIAIEPEAPQVRTALARLFLFKGQIDECREILRKLGEEQGLPPRLRRRNVSLLLQSYTREVERLAQLDEMEMALKELSELKQAYLGIPGSDIDYKTRRKVLQVKQCITRIKDFFAGTQNEPFSESLVEWYFLEFGNGTIVKEASIAPNVSSEAEGTGETVIDLEVGVTHSGVLMKLHSGFGFISSNGQSVFFPFAEWRSDGSPAHEMIGEKVEFVVGINHKGLCANNVKLLSVQKNIVQPGEVSELISGIIETCKDGYAFVKGDDGCVYFLPGAELRDNKLSISSLSGARIRFDAVTQASGRYPRATNADVIET